MVDHVIPEQDYRRNRKAQVPELTSTNQKDTRHQHLERPAGAADNRITANLFSGIRIEPPKLIPESGPDQKENAVLAVKETSERELNLEPNLNRDHEGLASLLPGWLVTRPASSSLPAPLTLLLIAFAVLGALLSPILAGQGSLALLVVGAIFGIAGAAILLRWPVVGLVSLPVLSMVVRFSISTGSQSGVNITAMMILLLTGLWLLQMLAQERQIRLLPFRAVTASLIFAVIALVAFGFGQLNWFPTKPAPLTAQMGGLMIFLLSVCAFLVYAHQIRSIKHLEWLTWVFFGIGFLFILMRTFPFLRPYVFQVYIRDAALGSVFFIWLISLSTSQVLFNHKLAPGWRIALGVFIALFFYQNMGTARFWISGWLPVVVSLAAIVLITKPRLGITLSLVGVVVLIAVPGIMAELMNEGDNTYSIITRLEAWRILAEIIRVSPLFGVGMANYYWYTSMFRILGYRVNFNSHNNYIDIMAQTGLMGLLAFLWLFWEVLRLAWRTLTYAPEGFARAYVIGAIGGLAGTAFAGFLGDWTIPFVYNVGLEGFRASVFAWIFLGGLLAVAKLYLPNSGGEFKSEAG